MTFDAEAYNLTIRREIIDGEPCFVGKVLEFPDLCAFEPSYEEARAILLDAINTLHDVAQEAGRPFPTPTVLVEEYSGRITLRLPRSLHRDAVSLANHEGVSLNQLITAFVAERVGASAGTTIPYAILLSEKINFQSTADASEPLEITFDNFRSAQKASGGSGR